MSIVTIGQNLGATLDTTDDLLIGEALQSADGLSTLYLGLDGRLMLWQADTDAGPFVASSVFASDVRMDRLSITDDGTVMAYRGNDAVAALDLGGATVASLSVSGDGVSADTENGPLALDTDGVDGVVAVGSGFSANYDNVGVSVSAGESLEPGQAVYAENAESALVLDFAGTLSLVRFDADAKLEVSETLLPDGVRADHIAFGSDGTITASWDGEPMWVAGSDGAADFAIMQNDHNFVYYSTDGHSLFAENAGEPCNATEGAVCLCTEDTDNDGIPDIEQTLFVSELRMPDGSEPGPDDIVVVQPGTKLIMDQDLEVKGLIINGEFSVQDGTDLSLTSDFAVVLGGGLFEVGTDQTPHVSDFTLTLTGDDPSFDLDLSAFASHTHGDTPGMIENDNAYLMAMGEGARIEIHAADATKTSWTQIDTTAEVGDTTLTLANDTGWQVGDKIGLATTDFDGQQSEEFTITAVSEDGLTITLDQPVQYMHWGEMMTYDNGKAGEDYQSWDLDMRAEVALLSRNVTIKGDEDSYDTGYGGHTMVMDGAEMHISGAHFDSMGQSGILGKYATHWHMSGDVDGQYVSNSSFTNIHHNAVQVHGTQNALVKDNSVWDVDGSAVFSEDGTEWGTHVEGNLSVKMGPQDNAEDSTQANFWFENPDVTLLENHAVGGGSGFMFAHEFGIDGETANDPHYADVEPFAQAGPTTFDGNTAHSTKWALYVKNMNLDGIENADWTVSDFTAFKAEKGIFARTEGGTFEDVKLADNMEGTYFRLNQTIEDSLIVGRTDNIGTPQTAEEIAQGRSLPEDERFFGINNYDGPFTATNIHFDGYNHGDGTEFSHDAAIGAFSGVDKTFNNVVQGLTFGDSVDEENKVWLTTGQLDGAWSATGVYDMDGSLTGTPNTFVTAHITNEGGSLITGGDNAVVREDWTALLTQDTQFARIEFVNLDEAGGAFDFSMTRSDGEVYNRSYGQDQFMVEADDAKTHTISLLNADVHQFRLELTELRMTDGLTFKFQDVPSLTDVYLTDPSTGAEARVAEVSTYAELSDANTSAVFRDTDGVHIRIIGEQTGDYHYLQPSVTTYGEGVQLGGAFVRFDTENLIDPADIELTTFATLDGVVEGEEGNDTIGLGYNDGSGVADGGGDRVNYGNDSILGRGGDDTISGLGGNDHIDGGIGDDSIDGGEGSDVIVGGTGDDTLSGGAGGDSLFGGLGDDVVDAGDGDDFVLATPGQDNVTGGAGDDTVSVGSDNDTADGGIGNDTIYGGTGDDLLTGGPATGIGDADLITGGGGADSILGGADDDLIYGDDPEVSSHYIGNVFQVGIGFQFTSGSLDSETDFNSSAVDIDLPAQGWRFVDPDGDIDTSLSATQQVDIEGTLYNATYGPNVSYTDGVNTYEFASVNVDLNGDGDTLDARETGQFLIQTSGPALTGTDSLTPVVGTYSTPVFTPFADLPQDVLSDTIDAGVGDDTVFGGGGDDSIAGGDGADTLLGDAGQDSISGDAGADSLFGGDGVDLLDGGADNDYIDAGIGDDTVTGGAGDDTLFGQLGADSLQGGTGQDTIYGGDDTDTIAGGDDADLIEGGAGFDSIAGGGGDDSISGGDGVDDISGGAGADILAGDAGDDIIAAGLGDDIVLGGTGNDYIDGQDDNDTLSGEDNDDTLLGNAGDDVLYGGSGADQLEGQTGADTLFGGQGLDSLIGGTGNDALFGDGEADYIEGGAGADSIDGGAGDDTLYGGDDADSIDGFSGDDTIFGGAGDDTIQAEFGADVVRGGAGRDSIDGFGDDDTLFGEDDDDSLFGNTGFDTLYGGSGADYLDGQSDADTLFGGVGADTLFGGQGDDTLFGDDDADRIEGGEGADSIHGGAGDDTVFGNDGADSIDGFSGHDTIYGGLGDDRIQAEFGDDEVYGGAGADSIDGFAGDDTLFGGDNDDHVLGEFGADALYGDAGDDTLEGAAGEDTLVGGTGADTLFGGDDDDDLVVAGGDVAFGDGGDDVFVVSGETSAGGPITIQGGETDEGGSSTANDAFPGATLPNGDVLDLSSVDVISRVYLDADGNPTFSPTEQGIVTYLDADGVEKTLNFSEIETVFVDSGDDFMACFTKGARVVIDEHGTTRAIEELDVGDLVWTLDHGQQPIRWIGSCSVPGQGARAPVLIRKGALGNTRDLRVSPQHRMLVSGWRADLLFDQPQVLVAAKHLVNDTTIRVTPCQTVSYYHLLFDQHQLLCVDGTWSESFFPGSQGLSSLQEPVRAELYDLFPELAVQSKGTGPKTCRTTLTAREAVLLRPSGV